MESATSTAVGSRRYTAPEVASAMNDEEIDPKVRVSYKKVDVFSMGMVFYKLLFNKLPFELLDLMDKDQKHILIGKVFTNQDATLVTLLSLMLSWIPDDRPSICCVMTLLNAYTVSDHHNISPCVASDESQEILQQQIEKQNLKIKQMQEENYELVQSAREQQQQVADLQMLVDKLKLRNEDLQKTDISGRPKEFEIQANSEFENLENCMHSTQDKRIDPSLQFRMPPQQEYVKVKNKTPPIQETAKRIDPSLHFRRPPQQEHANLKDKTTPSQEAAKQSGRESIQGISTTQAQILASGASKTLQKASEYGDLGAVVYLLDTGHDADETDQSTKTPLIRACTKGHLEVAKVLIERGADVNRACKLSWTPLLFASHMGHTSIVKLLIENGADLNKAKSNGDTALHLACARGYVEVAKMLIRNGARKSDLNKVGKTPSQLVTDKKRGVFEGLL